MYVEKVIVCDNGAVLVFFSDESRYEYSNETRLWREINRNIDLPEKILTTSHDNHKVLVGGKPIEKVIHSGSSD